MLDTYEYQNLLSQTSTYTSTYRDSTSRHLKELVTVLQRIQFEGGIDNPIGTCFLPLSVHSDSTAYLRSTKQNKNKQTKTTTTTKTTTITCQAQEAKMQCSIFLSSGLPFSIKLMGGGSRVQNKFHTGTNAYKGPGRVVFKFRGAETGAETILSFSTTTSTLCLNAPKVATELFDVGQVLTNNFQPR